MWQSGAIRDPQAELAAARKALLVVLDGLDDADWDRPTLCDGWRVREVVSHLAESPELGNRRRASRLLAARGRSDAAADRAARRGGARAPREILDHFRDHVERPARTRPAEALTDVVVHSLDICRPNGWEIDIPADRIRFALSTLITLGGSAGGRRRVEGLHLDTTDVDWRCGCGAGVRGPSRSLLLALAGRGCCDELTGDGVADLAAR